MTAEFNLKNPLGIDTFSQCSLQLSFHTCFLSNTDYTSSTSGVFTSLLSTWCTYESYSSGPFNLFICQQHLLTVCQRSLVNGTAGFVIFLWNSDCHLFTLPTKCKRLVNSFMCTQGCLLLCYSIISVTCHELMVSFIYIYLLMV